MALARGLILVVIYCDGVRKGRACRMRLGDVEKGAAYSFKCGWCNASKQGIA